jgi:hypothetical protein
MPQQVSILAALKVDTPWRTLTPERVEAVRAALSTTLAGARLILRDPSVPHIGIDECEIVVDRVIAAPGGES